MNPNHLSCWIPALKTIPYYRCIHKRTKVNSSISFHSTILSVLIPNFEISMFFFNIVFVCGTFLFLVHVIIHVYYLDMDINSSLKQAYDSFVQLECADFSKCSKIQKETKGIRFFLISNTLFSIHLASLFVKGTLSRLLSACPFIPTSFNFFLWQNTSQNDTPLNFCNM